MDARPTGVLLFLEQFNFRLRKWEKRNGSVQVATNEQESFRELLW